MIKIFSVISVLVFVSSAIKSFADETNLNIGAYEEIWTYSDQDGFKALDLNSTIQCNFISDSFKDSKLRVLERFLDKRLGIVSNIPLKEDPSDSSKTLSYVKPSTVVKLIEVTGDDFVKIETIKLFNDDSLNVESGYVSKNYLQSIYDHDIKVKTNIDDLETEVVLRSFESELAMCLTNNKMANRHPFESKDKKRLFLIKENSLGLFKSTDAVFSPSPVTTQAPLKLSNNPTPIEEANARLVNSGPDTPIVAWTPPVQPKPPSTSVGGVSVYEGSSNDVVCTINKDGVDVFTDEDEVLEDFPKALTGEIAIVSQDFEPRVVNEIKYIKVMFRDQNRLFGWIPEYSVKSRAECNSLNYPEAQYVETCTAEDGEVNARDESLNNVIKKIIDGSRALVISEEPREHEISGVNYNFVELQFEGEESTLWVPNKFITSGTCEKYKGDLLDELEAQRKEALENSIFPLYRHAEGSYEYGSSRGYNGRRCNGGWQGSGSNKTCPSHRRRNHAATDLLVRKISTNGYKGEFYRSISNGVVLRDADKFAGETYEIIVMDKKTGRIYRYGEVAATYGEPGSNKFVKAGDMWTSNQKIGRVRSISRGGTPMLHFELYSAGANNLTLKNPNGIDIQSDKKGPWGRYFRHSNLIDPTEFVKDLERNTPDLLPNRNGVNWL